MESLIAATIPLLLIVLFIRAFVFKKQIETQKYEDKTGDVHLYRLLWHEDVYHRSYCVDVIKDGGANRVAIESPEKAISEGIFPCHKCKPPKSSRQLQSEIESKISTNGSTPAL